MKNQNKQQQHSCTGERDKRMCYKYNCHITAHNSLTFPRKQQQKKPAFLHTLQQCREIDHPGPKCHNYSLAARLETLDYRTPRRYLVGPSQSTACYSVS